jgi:hypothetical protein
MNTSSAADFHLLSQIADEGTRHRGSYPSTAHAFYSALDHRQGAPAPPTDGRGRMLIRIRKADAVVSTVFATRQI